MQTKICQICNKEYKKGVFVCQKQWDKSRFCSQVCRSKWMENSVPWNKNKIEKVCGYCKETFEVSPYRKDIAQFCSLSCSASSRNGESGSNWKGGKTVGVRKARTNKEYRRWRITCLERDNFTCQKTGQSGGKLVVHHINNFKDFEDLRYIASNGITLSEKSHRDFHAKYGNTNNTLEQLQEFLLD